MTKKETEMTEKRRGNEKVSSHVENGDPVNIILLDSRLRGNDKKGCGRQRREVGMTVTITVSSP
ncbi:MAG: hypothetical protein SFT93_05780 [Rickettsiaceae bacterium]|nr:hypothetical protein [Rickettsiaceae bacterium]